MNTCCEREALREVLPEGADAERLGRVVAGGEQVDPGLAGVGHRTLGGFPGQQAVGARCRCVGDEVPAGARHDRQALDPLRAEVEPQRLTVGERRAPARPAPRP